MCRGNSQYCKIIKFTITPRSYTLLNITLISTKIIGKNTIYNIYFLYAIYTNKKINLKYMYYVLHII